MRKRKRAESPQKTETQVSEEWVDEDKLKLWEIKLFGEKYVLVCVLRSIENSPIFVYYFRLERQIVQTRTATGKLPVAKTPAAIEPSTANNAAKSATASPSVSSNHNSAGQKAGNEEFNKEKAEQDLRQQRAALNQKRAIEMQKNRGGK